MNAGTIDRIRTAYFHHLIWFFMMLFPFLQVYAEPLDVSGTVTTPTNPAGNVSVTFINTGDTTVQFSAVTNRSGSYTLSIATSVDGGNTQPSGFELEQNYPNPFINETAIPYQLEKAADARMTIYDILGREVRSIPLGRKSRGTYRIMWDGIDQQGQPVPAGVYFYRLQAGGEAQVRKMVLGEGFGDSPVSFSGFPVEGTRGFARDSRGIQDSEYTVRIENTSRSVPRIVPEEFTGITVSSDTTIDFTVEERIETGPATLTLSKTHQIIRGFGASNILAWRPDMTESEIETAFGTEEGQLGFTILRLMVEPNSDNWSRSVPTAKTAHEMGVTIIASPWHAPVEMRETINDEYRVRYDMYNAYAAHLDSFITYMAENGVPVYGISVQNEPDIGEWTQWTPDEMLTFVRDHAHAITGTNVMAPESFRFDRAYSDPILHDSLASANTDIICGHIYGGGLTPYPLAEQNGKEVWMTEYLINSGNPPSDLSLDIGWTGAMQTAQSINNCMNANMSAYVWWYLVRYYGPIADGTYTRKGEVTKKGYVMAQFSRFIRPGYHRVDITENPTRYVHMSAYTGNDRVVIVAINEGEQSIDQPFAIQGGTINSLIPYTTTETESMVQGGEIDVQNGDFNVILPPSSITTFVSQ